MFNSETIKFYASNYKEGVIYQAKATNGNTKLGKAIFNINLPPVITL